MAQYPPGSLRPWGELVDRNFLHRPESIGDFFSRLKPNLSYFRVNYGCLIFTCMALSIILQPIRLLWLALVAFFWYYLFNLRSAPLVIGGREYHDAEKFIGLSIFTVLILFVFTGVGSAIMGGFFGGLLLVLVHAGFRIPDNLYAEQSQPFGGALHAFGTGPASAHHAHAKTVSYPAAQHAGYPQVTPAPSHLASRSWAGPDFGHSSQSSYDSSTLSGGFDGDHSRTPSVAASVAGLLTSMGPVVQAVGGHIRNASEQLSAHLRQPSTPAV